MIIAFKKIFELIRAKGGFFRVLSLSKNKLKKLGFKEFFNALKNCLNEAVHGRYSNLQPLKKDNYFWSSHFETVTVGSSLEGVVHAVRPVNENDFSIEVPFECQLNDYLLKNTKICVVLHAYYTDISESIIGYLSNIPYRYDLYVSTDTEHKKNILKSSFEKLKNVNNIEIKVFPNRGRDIAPKLVGFSEVYSKYEYFLHIHTKKSPHGGSPLSVWRKYLFEHLLGSEKIVISILNLLQKNNVGVVFPQHLFDLRGVLNWGYDYDRARILLKRMGVSINSKSLLEFPSGSMFWGRTKFLEPWIGLKLKFEDFDEELGQIDGTLAHSIERSYLFSCEASSTTWLKISCHNYGDSKTSLILNDKNFDNIFSKVYRPLTEDYQNSNLLAVNRLNPQCARFIKFPSYLEKPRINLLVPTVNKSQMFGGVNTAIKIFEDLIHERINEYDFRVIATDAPFFLNERKVFNNFQYEKIASVRSDDVHMQVIDASSRDGAYLFIRETDVFISTAWWTADLAESISRFQKLNFGTKRKSVYLIQDYEACFYPWSSNWVLANNTYNVGENVIAIFNSEELYGYFANYNFSSKYILPYSPNAKIKNCLSLKNRKNIILIYGRPSVSRNCFEILVDSIYKWQIENPRESDIWNIISLGEDYPISWVSHVKNISIMGKVTLEQYADYLSEASIGISLMISPHPSYPPLEMAMAGMLVITNDFNEKNLSSRSKNISAVKKIDSEEISKALERAVFCINSGFEFPRIDIEGIKIPDDAKLYDKVNFIAEIENWR